MASQKVIIMGAAGRDFHNFNTYYRDNPSYEVVAFTEACIRTGFQSIRKPNWRT